MCGSVANGITALDRDGVRGGVFACKYERRTGASALPVGRFQERGPILGWGDQGRAHDIQEMQELL
jgi:hypothetical protein